MTKEEILNMEPGLELDRLVAEWVMGWKEEHIEDDRWHINANFWCRGNEIGPQVQKWSPSTDIAAAWEVVEKLASQGIMVVIESQGPLNNIYKVLFYRWGTNTIVGMAEGNICEAICRAALLAVQSGEEKG